MAFLDLFRRQSAVAVVVHREERALEHVDLLVLELPGDGHQGRAPQRTSGTGPWTAQKIEGLLQRIL